MSRSKKLLIKKADVVGADTSKINFFTGKNTIRKKYIKGLEEAERRVREERNPELADKILNNLKKLESEETLKKGRLRDKLKIRRNKEDLSKRTRIRDYLAMTGGGSSSFSSDSSPIPIALIVALFILLILLLVISGLFH